MQGARLFVLLSSVWSGGFGLKDTTQTWTTSEVENSQEMASASVPLNKLPRHGTLPTPQILSAEMVTGTRTSAQGLLPSASLPSETSAAPAGVGRPALTSTAETEERVLKLQTLAPLTRSSIEFGPRAQSVVLSNSTLKFLQSFASKSNQVASLNSAGGVGNRSPRETSLSRGDARESQRASYQKSSFETTRGK